jgi:hypothetical protein
MRFIFVFVAALVGFTFAVPAQIYVSSYSGSTGSGWLGEYSTSGSPINPTLVTGFNLPQALALSPDGNLLVADNFYFNISEYTLSGAAVHTPLVSLTHPAGIAISGSTMYVTQNDGVGNVAVYNTSGGLINPTLITGMPNPAGIVVQGGNLFVANFGSSFTGTIGEYTTSGAPVNPSLITGLEGAGGLASDGFGHLFVSDAFGSRVAEYSISGTLLNANFITGLSSPGYLYCDGNGDLYVCNQGNNTIGEYTISGAVVNATLITGVLDPQGIIVVPEPSSLVLVLTAAVLGLAKTGVFLRKH